MSPESAYYPMCLNLKGRTCIVVGGGRVALRKVRKLLEYGADVRVISPELCPELAGLLAEGKIQVNSRPYQPGDLRQAWLAFAATGDPDTNQRVAAEARTWRIWVNVASDAENSDFILPSSGRRGNITIAVSTDGVSPALARKIRTRLENTIGNEYAILLELVGEVRAEIKNRGLKLDDQDWQEALDLDLLLELLGKGERGTAWTMLLDRLTSRRR